MKPVPCDKHSITDWSLVFHKLAHDDKKFSWYCEKCSTNSNTFSVTVLPCNVKAHINSDDVGLYKMTNETETIDRYFLHCRTCNQISTELLYEEVNYEKQRKTSEDVQTICDNLNRIFRNV